jgi:hypothetical protein
MLRRIRPRITYANVISTLALCLAMGGVSYAALKLPANSVGSKQLKNNSVTSPKVKNRSLLAKDFKTGQLPSGAKGDKGDKGDQGTQGAAGSAKAFGFVDPQGCTADACAVTHNKGNVTVRRLGGSTAGIYCIKAAGATVADDIAIAGVDFPTTTNPEGNASAEGSSNSTGCNADEFKVLTERIPSAGGAAAAANDVGFWVAIL